MYCILLGVSSHWQAVHTAQKTTEQRVAISSPARALCGAVIGSATGISALLLYTNGLFVAGLARDFGLTRTQFGFGVLLVTMALALANPAVGWAIDRFGAKRPSVVGLLLLSLGFAGLGASVSSVESYLALQAVVAFLGAASGPVAYTKIVGAAFDRHRGIALGITMTGIGLAATVIPPVLAQVIARYDWRAGYWALSAIPLAGAIATLAVLPRSAANVSSLSTLPQDSGRSEPAHWVHSRTFWIMAAAFATMSLSFVGLLPHFVPLLTDTGMSAVAAGRIAGEIGLAVVASRLLVGFLLDRVFAPYIAIGVSVIAAGGFVFLILGGPSAASVAAITLGFAIGAELDLMGFLVSRYFGLREFGRIYGWLYSAFIFASGLGPLWVGFTRDLTGTYTLALAIGATGLLIACAVFLLLPRYQPRTTR
jgi:MFS family permease